MHQLRFGLGLLGTCQSARRVLGLMHTVIRMTASRHFLTTPCETCQGVRTESHTNTDPGVPGRRGRNAACKAPPQPKSWIHRYTAATCLWPPSASDGRTGRLKPTRDTESDRQSALQFMAAREEDACCSSEDDDTDELASFLEARLEEVAGNSEQTSKKFERIVAEFGVSR